MSKFKIGDSVLIAKHSSYYGDGEDIYSPNPINTVGQIEYISDWISVNWENGTYNSYKENDLELYEKPKTSPCAAHDKESEDGDYYVVDSSIKVETTGKEKERLKEMIEILNTPKVEEKESFSDLDVVINQKVGKTVEQLTGATKHDQGKVSFSAIPQLALMEVAKGFQHGINHYGKFNYSKPMELLRLLDAGDRHTWKTKTFYDVNDIDPETGVHHLALVACNALMALDQILTGKVIDDRNQVYAKQKE